jgi:hypothetical protein
MENHWERHWKDWGHVLQDVPDSWEFYASEDESTSTPAATVELSTAPSNAPAPSKAPAPSTAADLAPYFCEGDPCVICFEDFDQPTKDNVATVCDFMDGKWDGKEPKKVLVTLPCKHLLCGECFRKLRACDEQRYQATRCPVCKEKTHSYVAPPPSITGQGLTNIERDAISKRILAGLQRKVDQLRDIAKTWSTSSDPNAVWSQIPEPPVVKQTERGITVIGYIWCHTYVAQHRPGGHFSLWSRNIDPTGPSGWSNRAYFPDDMERRNATGEDKFREEHPIPVVEHHYDRSPWGQIFVENQISEN